MPSRLQVIVTSNIRHYPRESLDPLGLDVQDPDRFLTHVYHLDPPVVQRIVREQAAALRNPPMDVKHVLRNLEHIAPAVDRFLLDDAESQGGSAAMMPSHCPRGRVARSGGAGGRAPISRRPVGLY